MVGLLIIALLGQKPFAPRPSFINPNEVLRLLPGAPRASLECAGTVAGSFGQAVTFTRASSATCTKSDGSISTLITDVPRVQSTGLLSERAATNLLLRSQEFDNAAWTAGNAAGGTAPTVTANSATVAPDGTATADRVQFSATPSAGDASYVAQAITAAAAVHSVSCYLRATTGTATTNLTFYRSGVSVFTATPSLTTAWTRVTLENKTATATAWTVEIGSDRRAANGNHSTTAAADVLIWGCQAEAGQFVSSYIATVGSTVTRALDTASIANPIPSTATQWCASVTINGATWPSVAGSFILTAGSYAGNNTWSMRLEDGTGKPIFSTFDNAGGNRYVVALNPLATGRHRLRACDNAGVLSLTADGAVVANPAGAGTGVMTTQAATIRLGNYNGNTAALNTGLSDVCITKDLQGCNP